MSFEIKPCQFVYSILFFVCLFRCKVTINFSFMQITCIFLHFLLIIFCQAYCLAQFLSQNLRQYLFSFGMKKFLLLCISILQVAFLPLFAQHTLSGTILSKTDGAPIEMATIRLFVYPTEDMYSLYAPGRILLSTNRPS